MPKHLILGTAGHIDHGKTSLIGALTGTNTDRLPEEKKRGITIELGYAHLDLPPFQLGVVDVPGHEKFVRQMLAGATGMDVVLLVVAGDDSIKQQTTEHLDILRMLDLPAGVIALTKCDLCDPDWLELVEDEIRQLVGDTFLHDAPIIRTSSKTGDGIDDLKQALVSAAEIASAAHDENTQAAPFRMAIDRSFSIEGHGTVVTGSVNSGKLAVGDQMLIEPGHIEVRVRGVQNHDASCDTVERGQRAAINLAGVHHNAIGRGHELATPGHLKPSTLMTVQLSLLDRVKRPLKDRTRVRFHIGTAELFANIRLMGHEELAPGETGFAQVFLNEPAVAVWHQPFVIRFESPVETIGGGTILFPNAARIKKPSELDLQMMRALASSDELARASASVYFCDDLDWDKHRLSRDAGIMNIDSIHEQLCESGDLVEVSISQTRTATIHRQRFAELGTRILKTLERMHAAQPLRFHHPRTALDHEFAYLNQPELLALVIDDLKKEKKVVANVNNIGLVGYGPKLSKGQKALLDELVGKLQAAGIEAPTVADLVKSAKKNKESVAELLEMAAENGNLVAVANDFFLHTSTMDQIKAKLTEAIDENGMTMSDIRKVLETSRKYAIPILEYLDSIKFTIRDGDLRRIG
ncbi:MAG: selenocysteine-specific translation elongation factor [Planctomycetota bacterium]